MSYSKNKEHNQIRGSKILTIEIRFHLPANHDESYFPIKKIVLKINILRKDKQFPYIKYLGQFFLVTFPCGRLPKFPENTRIKEKHNILLIFK